MTASLTALTLLFNPQLRYIMGRPLEASGDSEFFDLWVVHERVNQSFMALWLPNGLPNTLHVGALFC